MEKTSIYKLLGILRRLNNLPSKEVKQELDGLDLKFSEWQILTNEDLGYFMYGQIHGYKQKFEDKVDISYEEYLEMQHLPITREMPRESNIARRERQRREHYKVGIEDGKYSEKQLHVMTEDEISTLEEIESLWENVRAKYDPVQEVIRSAKEAGDVFEYGTTSNRLPSSISEVKRSISQLKKSTRYIDESRELDEECLDFEEDLIKAMEEGLRVLEELQSSDELSVDEFINKFGLNKEEINDYFKKRMETAALGKSGAPFIKANEGRGFKLNEEGELEIIDESKAKDLIVDAFFAEKVLGDSINTLGRAEKYKMLTQYLPERPENSVGTKEVEGLIEEIGKSGNLAIANWMIENQKRISAMLSALEDKGIIVDLNDIIRDLSTELGDSYEDDPEYDEDRLQKIAEFIRMNYVPKEYVGEYGEESRDEYTENSEEEYGESSEESIAELTKRVADNDKKIADNDKKIRQALKDRILSQQQVIEKQEREIAQLRGEMSNEK